MSQDTYLSQLEMKGIPLRHYQYQYVNDRIRIYYCQTEYEDMEKGGHGFEFYAVEWAGEDVIEPDKLPSDKKHWDPEHTYVNTFFHGTACFDGIRHLYQGSEETGDEGYHYYPSCEDYILFFAFLGALEKAHCRDVK